MEKTISLLMEKIIIKENTFLYKPIHCIEGVLDEEQEIFKDSLDKEYLSITNKILVFSEITECYAYPVLLSELKKQYPEIKNNEQKLIQRYYKEMTEKIYIGKFLPGDEYVQNIILDLNHLLKNIMNLSENENEFLEKVDLEYDESNVGISISVKFLEELLNIDNMDELKRMLGDIKSGFEEFKKEVLNIDKLVQSDNNKTFLEKETKTEEKIYYLSINYIDNLLKLNDLEEIIEELKKCDKLLKPLIDCFTIDAEIMEKILDEDDIDKMKTNLLAVKTGLETRKANQNINRQKELEETFEAVPNKYDVKKIYQQICKTVIGQEEAIKDVVTAIVMDKYSKKAADRTRCLLVGPTGCGKTKIISCLSEQFDMPFVHVDSTQLTAQGYVGGTIEEKLSQLLEKAGGDIKKAENGIFVLDEIDKKGSSSNEDVSGKAVLNMLLPFIDGTDYTINFRGKSMKFNTSKLTIFAAGAFTDVFKGKAMLQKNSPGFGGEFTNKNVQVKLEPKDFVNHGLMPDEFIGRFPVISQLNNMNEEMLKKIILESDASPLLVEQEKLDNFGIELCHDDSFIDAVAKKAMTLEIGARSLKSIIESSIKEARFETLCDLYTYKKIVITEETVENNKIYKLEK